MRKGLKLGLIIAAVFFVLSVAAGIIFFNASSSGNCIYEGVFIEGMNVGKMTVEKAIDNLNDKFDSGLKAKKIILAYEGKKYSIDYKLANVHYNVEETVKKAFEIGKEGNIFTKTLSQWRLKKNHYDLKMDLIIDGEVIKREIEKISKEINTNPIDAKISFDGEKFNVTPDKEGIAVDWKKLYDMIVSSIKSPSDSSPIEIPIVKTAPRFSSEVLSKISTRISKFTTSFRPSDANRTENLKIAVEAVDGTLIMPGEIFSMNKVLGPRLESKGYKEAPIIINNTVIPGLAGGICQVCTTVYNAALYGDFDIVERKQHGILVSYVGAGRDATISGNSIDFKFRNNNKYPIYINAQMGKSTLTVNIYGANERPASRVELSTEIVEWIKADVEYINDPTLNLGEKVVEIKPIQGAKSKTYKKVFENGKLISSKLISSDNYKPVKGIIRIGTKPLVVEPQSPVVTQEEGVGEGNQNNDSSQNTNNEINL